MTSRISTSCYDVNVRLAYAMRCIGKGRKAAQIFCALMALPPPAAKFERYNKILLDSLTTVSTKSMKDAVSESVSANDDNCDISAAFDGTWQKRGHTSLNGVVCATSLDTGKVIDFECLTKYCSICETQSSDKIHDCNKNFDGFSGGMEAEGVLSIFKRSQTTRGVRYVQYLGDGDSKGHEKVSNAKVYGEGISIEKLECVGHVQKRMGARLRKLRKDMKNKKLSDQKIISGRGRLTETEIDHLQQYYGLAIRRSAESGSVKVMQKAVWATYFHKLSTDENPQHGLCPDGEDSWCGYQKAQSSGTCYLHKHSLPEAVLEVMKPIYRSLTENKLLIKCLHGQTQNANESFNNCIWERVPKTVFVGIQTLKIGVMDAIICFNDGAISRIKVFRDLGIEPSKNTINSLMRIDNQRILEADAAASAMTKEARTKKRCEMMMTNDDMTLNQCDYGAGLF